ncbi:MAG: nucleotide exchange factor GrpE [Candidatus Pacebacteria bacterium]|jgi:molecular chaperone GrpE|nr:nucleotide exchange factor GrpE [Candidatus Paceibacterota bacterium]MBT4652463.1 nucleotide exchange factor GrpE [Candidatus Paceibacterota bacterium]MBT6756290.1 nucleotide exchange factor GrpE [Candidatus Paceibacterota bacterium]MBT6921581.1 nucleotide exchange factor GrpE [Candidatus Paceibacterota bacterium]
MKIKKDKTTPATDKVLEKAQQRIIELEEQLHLAQEKEKRSLADYHNLVRRTQEERMKTIQMANRDLMESLVQPFEHLQMASTQIEDTGLSMVLEQLKKVLNDFGLEEIDVIGKEFDVEIMEAVEKTEKGETVTRVAQKGYRLNGVVIQHAKVVLD